MSIFFQHISPAATQPVQNRNLQSPQEEPKAGASWIAAEQHIIPYNHLGILISGLMTCMALTAFGQVVSIPVTCGDPLILMNQLQ
jgi:hypothetical protein